MFKVTEFIEKEEQPSFSTPNSISHDKLGNAAVTTPPNLGGLRHKIFFSLQIPQWPGKNIQHTTLLEVARVIFSYNYFSYIFH